MSRMSSKVELSQMDQEIEDKGVPTEAMAAGEEEEETIANGATGLGEEEEVDEDEDEQLGRGKSEEGGFEQSTAVDMSCSSRGTTESGKPKRKKAKGRNGNIYIGVTNRIEWFRLQEKFGFDNVNLFGNFVMNYMEKVYSDFDILHQMTVKTGIFEEQGLTGFRWVNGMPHPLNAANEFISLPVVNLPDEVADEGFKIAYDLIINRNQDLSQLSPNVPSDPATPGVLSDVASQNKSDDIKTEEIDEESAGTDQPSTPLPSIKVELELDSEGRNNSTSTDEKAMPVLEKEASVNQKTKENQQNDESEDLPIDLSSSAIDSANPTVNPVAEIKNPSPSKPAGKGGKRKAAKKSTSTRRSTKKPKVSKVQK